MQNSITFVLFYLISCLLLYCDQTFQLQLVRRIEVVVVSCIETVPVCRTILLLSEIEKSVVTPDLAANGAMPTNKKAGENEN